MESLNLFAEVSVMILPNVQLMNPNPNVTGLVKDLKMLQLMIVNLVDVLS